MNSHAALCLYGGTYQVPYLQVPGACYSEHSVSSPCNILLPLFVTLNPSHPSSFDSSIPSLEQLFLTLKLRPGISLSQSLPQLLFCLFAQNFDDYKLYRGVTISLLLTIVIF